LTNFTARIVTDIVEDDGIQVTHHLEIEAECRGRKRRLRVPAKEFVQMNWPIENLGGEAVIAAGNSVRDHARCAIQLLSGHIARRRVYLHTGWRKIGKRWSYLHGGGAIDRYGLYDSIRVKLPTELESFILPDPPAGNRLKTAVRASLRFLDIAPRHITVPIYGAIWRAVVDTADFGLHLYGPTNTFKTCLAALAMNHFGAKWSDRHLPASWQSTANANGALQFILKDALLVIDDFSPGGSRVDIDRMQSHADRVFRGQGNNAGRGRMARDISLRNPQPPRGLTLSTGEELPRGESLRTRVWIDNFSPGDVDKKILAECQRDARAGLYAEGMSAFLKSIAPRLDATRRRLRDLVRFYRTKATRDGQHARTPEIMANLMAGIDLFLEFAEECGAVSASDAEQIGNNAWKSLLQASAAQTRELTAEEPARRFLDLVGAAILRGDAHLDSEGSENDFVGSSPAAKFKSKLIGWKNDRYIFLLPDSAFAVAHQLAAEQGESFPITQKTLGKRLEERGFLAAHNEDRNTLQRTIAGGRHRIWYIEKSRVFPRPEDAVGPESQGVACEHASRV
ncbi:MAG: hypothetical protein WA002_17645, partial [Candidatus Acidiferrales bacterium]